MPIPLEPTEQEFQGYVRNIVDAYNYATPDQLQRGNNWYAVARDVALAISGDVVKGAGVIAAMSARTEWNDNVNRARRAFDTGTPTGHTQVILAKAARIMDGEDPATVLPMELKTGNFYRCIVDPDTEDAVVIDRHAHDVAIGERWGDSVNRGLSSKKRYAVLAHAYREAARVVGNTPARVQAVTWVVQVSKYQYTRA